MLSYLQSCVTQYSLCPFYENDVLTCLSCVYLSSESCESKLGIKTDIRFPIRVVKHVPEPGPFLAAMAQWILSLLGNLGLLSFSSTHLLSKVCTSHRTILSTFLLEKKKTTLIYQLKNESGFTNNMLGQKDKSNTVPIFEQEQRYIIINHIHCWYFW